MPRKQRGKRVPLPRGKHAPMHSKTQRRSPTRPVPKVIKSFNPRGAPGSARRKRAKAREYGRADITMFDMYTKASRNKRAAKSLHRGDRFMGLRNSSRAK
jgi:hypothetical protein